MSAANHMPKLESEKDEAGDLVRKLEFEHVRLSARLMYLKEQVSELCVDMKCVTTKLVAVSTHRDNLNDDLISQRTEWKRMCATLVVKKGLVELVWRQIAGEEASIV